MYRQHIWDTQKNIEAEEKEAQNTEEIKKGRKRNRLSYYYSFIFFKFYILILFSLAYYIFNYILGEKIYDNFKNSI